MANIILEMTLIISMGKLGVVKLVFFYTAWAEVESYTVILQYSKLNCLIAFL